MLLWPQLCILNPYQTDVLLHLIVVLFLCSFAVELSIRTLAHSGILYYMANANQQDYAVLQLLGGRLLLSCDLGKGPAITSSHTHVSDGQWHTVSYHFICLKLPVWH